MALSLPAGNMGDQISKFARLDPMSRSLDSDRIFALARSLLPGFLDVFEFINLHSHSRARDFT